jgi:hypothetical protein
LFKQEMPSAFVRALLNAGNSIAARMAMMAMTTSNSIRVNPPFVRRTARRLFVGSRGGDTPRT